MAELNIWKNHIWSDPGLRSTVAFAPDAIEQIRRAAVEGMLSLRRVGVGVGGFLLGRYAGGRITILDSREIACAHNFGPSFRLTPEEVTAALAPLAETGDLRVVGLYCSKPRGPAEVTDDDRRLFESLCPERWQALLVVSPKSNNGSTGAVFSRGAGQTLVGGAQLPIEERCVTPAAVEAGQLEPVPTLAAKSATTPLTKGVKIPRPVPVPEVRQEPAPLPPPPPARKAEPRPKAPREPIAALRRDVPVFSRTVRKKRAGLSPWAIWVGGAVFLVTLCLGAFLTRDSWMPRPPLELRSYDSSGQLTVEWNRAAVRGIESASLLFTDGTDTKTVILNGAQIHSGWFRYARKTGLVAVIFRAGSLQETTTYKDKPLAPVAPQLTQPQAAPLPRAGR